jgi:hypothetical protein
MLMFQRITFSYSNKRFAGAFLFSRERFSGEKFSLQQSAFVLHTEMMQCFLLSKRKLSDAMFTRGIITYEPGKMRFLCWVR